MSAKQPHRTKLKPKVYQKWFSIMCRNAKCSIKPALMSPIGFRDAILIWNDRYDCTVKASSASAAREKLTPLGEALELMPDLINRVKHVTDWAHAHPAASSREHTSFDRLIKSMEELHGTMQRYVYGELGITSPEPLSDAAEP